MKVFFRIFFCVFILVFSYRAKAQDYVESIYGFKINQFKESISNSLKIKPFEKNKFEDGWEYEAYWVDSAKTISLVFQFKAGNEEVIHSVQITGLKSDFSVIKNLKLGASLNEVIQTLGQPKSKMDVPEISGIRYDYEGSNYSIEMVRDKLFSVKIVNNSGQLFNTYDASKIPSFESIMAIFASHDKKKIGELLHPSFEIYKNNEIVFWEYKYDDEINYDKSGVFKILLDSNKGFDKLVKDKEYDENIRVVEKSQDNTNFLHVWKFGSQSPIKEVVFKYYGGSYKIWEIKLAN